MKKLLFCTIVTILMLFTPLSFSTASITSKTIYVDDDGGADYNHIQDAIDASSPGDTIFVYNGKYTENIVINKNIILTGENKENTIINSSSNQNIINISANNIEINGFTIEKTEGYSFYHSIEIQSNNTKIYNNKFTNKETYYYPYGIYITSNRVNNHIFNNTFIDTGLGINPENIKTNNIHNNTINSQPLIYLESVSDQVISNAGQIILKDCTNITIQKIEIKKTPVAITSINSNDCLINNCTIRANDKGIICKKSNGLKIIENDIKANNQGIYISNSENIIITKNDIYQNSEALFSENCKKSELNLNNFYSNGFCLNIYYSNLNTIKHNNFGNNIRNVFSLFCSLNTYDNNYWNRPRVFPKLILEFPRLNLDWNPAQTPFSI